MEGVLEFKELVIVATPHDLFSRRAKMESSPPSFSLSRALSLSLLSPTRAGPTGEHILSKKPYIL